MPWDIFVPPAKKAEKPIPEIQPEEKLVEVPKPGRKKKPGKEE